MRKAWIIILASLLLSPALLFSSFKLIHNVSVNKTLSTVFMDGTGNTIQHKNISKTGFTQIGDLYATYNSTQNANFAVTWTSLLLEDQTTASADNTIDFTMHVRDSAGRDLSSFNSVDLANTDSFVVYGELSTGTAYFNGVELVKIGSETWINELIGSFSLEITETDRLPAGRYCGTISVECTRV